jgi:Trypsin-like peptidase domain
MAATFRFRYVFRNASLFSVIAQATVCLFVIVVLTLPARVSAESGMRASELVIGLKHYGLHFGLLRQSVSVEVATGWCVDPECDVVITNYHVMNVIGPHTKIKGVRVVEVASATSEADHDARVLPTVLGPMKFAPGRDISLLTMAEPLARKGMHAVPFYLGQLDPGQKVTAMGFPGGKLRSIQGTFVQEYAEGLLSFEMAHEVSPGISGALVIDEKGRAVGLAIGFSSDHHSMYAVPVWSVADFIRKTKPQLYAKLFTDEIYRGTENSKVKGEQPQDEPEEPTVDVFAEDFPASLQEGFSPVPVLPEDYLLLNDALPNTPIIRQNVSAAVLSLRRSAQLMSLQMKNFVARQTLLLSNGGIWQHELQVVDGRQRFRTINGKDLFELPLKGNLVPGAEWSELVKAIGFNSSLAVRFERDTTIGNQAVKVFHYQVRPEDQICQLRVARKFHGMWKGSVPCTGAIWTDGQFRILRITQDMTPPLDETGVAGFRIVILYGWWGQRLVPVAMYLRTRTTDGKTFVSRAKFDDYRVFTATTKIAFQGEAVENGVADSAGSKATIGH